MDQEEKAYDRLGKFVLILVAAIGAGLVFAGNPAGWGFIALAVGATIFFGAIHYYVAIRYH